jgi:hypothetical protein
VRPGSLTASPAPRGVDPCFASKAATRSITAGSRAGDIVVAAANTR